jgi:hypothetical protein
MWFVGRGFQPRQKQDGAKRLPLRRFTRSKPSLRARLPLQPLCGSRFSTLRTWRALPIAGSQGVGALAPTKTRRREAPTFAQVHQQQVFEF